MIARNLIYIAVACFSTFAQAVDLYRVDDGVFRTNDCDMNTSGYQRSFRDLLHKTNLVLQDGEVATVGSDGQLNCRDPREPITKIGSQIGLRDDEIAKIRSTSGFCKCPNAPSDSSGSQPRRGAIGSCFVAGEGNEIRSAGHLVFNDSTGFPRGPIGQCVFVTQDANSPKEVRFDSARGAVRLMSNYPEKGSEYDQSIGRLSSRVSSTNDLLPMDSNHSCSLSPGADLIVVSAFQKGVRNQTDPREPIAQKCKVKAVSRAVDENSFFSDCAGAQGGSGSMTLAMCNGRWTVVGIMVSSGESKNDCKSFNLPNDNAQVADEGSYSHHIRLIPESSGKFTALETFNSGVRRAAFRQQTPRPSRPGVDI